MNTSSLTSSSYPFVRAINTHLSKIDSINKKLSTGNKQVQPSDIITISYFESQKVGNATAQKNIQDAISLIDTVQSSLAKVSDIGNRLRELAITYNSETVSEQDKQIIEYEAKKIAEEIAETFKNTKFKGQNPFEKKIFNIQTGANAGEKYILQFGDINKVLSEIQEDKIETTPNSSELSENKETKDLSQTNEITKDNDLKSYNINPNNININIDSSIINKDTEINTTNDADINTNFSSTEKISSERNQEKNMRKDIERGYDTSSLNLISSLLNPVSSLLDSILNPILDPISSLLNPTHQKNNPIHQEVSSEALIQKEDSSSTVTSVSTDSSNSASNNSSNSVSTDSSNSISTNSSNAVSNTDNSSETLLDSFSQGNKQMEEETKNISLSSLDQMDVKNLLNIDFIDKILLRFVQTEQSKLEVDRKILSYRLEEQENKEILHSISRRRLPLQRPKGVSGRGMRVPPFFCV